MLFNKKSDLNNVYLVLIAPDPIKSKSILFEDLTGLLELPLLSVLEKVT